MQRSVRLALKKETLAALSADDLRFGAGAAGHTLEIDCFLVIGEHSVILVTECCSAIPTFHGGC